MVAWPNGCRVAVSLSFDDARPSQIEKGVPVLDAHGVRGTFYVSPHRLDAQLDAWRAAVATGHEIGNHTVTHPCSGNFRFGRRGLEDMTLAEMNAELLEANARIGAALGIAPSSFAYPCGQTFVGRGAQHASYVPLVAQHFLAGRGFREEHINDPDFCDLAKLAGTEGDGLSFDGYVAVLERAARRSGWVIFAMHEVGSHGAQTARSDALAALCAWCRDPANGVWIDTVSCIAAALRDTRGW